MVNRLGAISNVLNSIPGFTNFCSISSANMAGNTVQIVVSCNQCLFVVQNLTQVQQEECKIVLTYAVP